MPIWLAPIIAVAAVLGLIPFSQARARFTFILETMRLISKPGRSPDAVEITGHLQNKSTRLRYVAELYLVLWLPNRRDTKLFEAGPAHIQEGTDDLLPHIRFDGGEERRITATWEVTGLDAGPAPSFEFVIKDSTGKYFDQRGRLISRKNIERRQELANRRIGNISDGGKRPVRLLHWKIVVCDVGFMLRRASWFLLGL